MKKALFLLWTASDSEAYEMLYERGLGMDISLAAEKMRVWFSFSLPNFNSCLKGPVRKVRPVRPKTVDPEKKKKKKKT